MCALLIWPLGLLKRSIMGLLLLPFWFCNCHGFCFTTEHAQSHWVYSLVESIIMPHILHSCQTKYDKFLWHRHGYGYGVASVSQSACPPDRRFTILSKVHLAVHPFICVCAIMAVDTNINMSEICVWALEFFFFFEVLKYQMLWKIPVYVGRTTFLTNWCICET